MSDRIEMSFKNKEIRMWFIVMVPTVLIGMAFLYVGGVGTIYHYLLLPLSIVSQLFYYIWRSQHRKKQQNG